VNDVTLFSNYVTLSGKKGLTFVSKNNIIYYRKYLKNKKMKNSNNAVKLIGALLIGASIGGALGILFAPDKGSKTRKKITRKSENITDELEEKFNNFLKEIKREVETVKNKANEFVENGKAKAEKFR